MRSNPKIVSLDSPMSAAAGSAGLVPNAAALLEMFSSLRDAPVLLSRLGFRAGESDPVALLQELHDTQLGTGAFARAFRSPSGSVLKVTVDEDDAMVAQLIAEAGGQVPGLVGVDAVYRLPGRVRHHGVDRKAFVIISEEVYPLDKAFDALEHGEPLPPGVWSREMRQLSFAINALARVARNATPDSVLSLAMQSADDHYDVDEIGMIYVHDLAQGWAFMARHGYVMVDLHIGNVGFDRHARPVILDFGLSSTPSSTSGPIEMAENPSPKIDRVFDECFDRVEELFDDFGTCEFYADEKAGSDNGAGSERQFAYCQDGDPIAIAFAPKASKLPESHLRGLMRHEFGHALEYRYGVRELEKRLGRRLPEKVERRADAIAEAVWGEPIVYDDKLVQCVGIEGLRPRPAHLPDERAKLRPNPGEHLLISIDRELTRKFGGPNGIVAYFDEETPLFRVIDGSELALAFDRGRFEGGMFATPSERRWGASWATGIPEDLARWGADWAKRGRLGEDLFVVSADGRLHTFYREGAQAEGVSFDPEGSDLQETEMPASLCNTGLGCSVLIDFDNVEVSKVEPDGSLRPMSKAEVERYVQSRPVKDVDLRNFGFGTEWYAGTILGKSVVVGRDQEDGLWLVRDRDDKVLVVGARSKDAAIREAKKEIEAGRYGSGYFSRLNRVPDAFDEVEEGMRFRAKGYPPFEGTVQKVGASYVVLRGRRPRDEYDDVLQVQASELMRRWEPVDVVLANGASDMVFYRVGDVERPVRRRGRLSYDWHPGYSTRADGGAQPWVTREEAQAEARRDGKRARFEEGERR